MPTPGTPTSPPARARIVEIHQDEVLTGEAVALDVQPIGYFLRAVGTLIDMIVGAAVAVVVLLLMRNAPIDPSLAPIITIAMLVLVTVVIPVTVETATRGRSLGKLAVGGRIVRTDGGAIGFRQAFIRALIGVLELWFTVGGLAALVGAFTARSQRLGDLVAGTYSERTRTPRLPEPAPGVPAPLLAWAQVADVARLPDSVARRAAQFVANADALEPAARLRLAGALAADVAPFVSPVPAADPETFVRAVVAVRRDRELHALLAENDRVAALLPK